MKKKILSLLLAALMLFSLLPTMAFAAEYGDTSGHWGESAIDRWSDYGVVGGKGNGVFDPDGLMKRGEAAQVFANLFKLTAKGDLSDYTDVGLGKWYDDAIAKCVAAGILSGKGAGTMDPEGTITREEFFAMFARALDVEPETTATVVVADGGQAASWAAGYITALVNRGYVKGTVSADGVVTVEPKQNINRASVMSLMDQTITTYVNTTEKVTAGDGLTLIVVDNANVTFAKDAESTEVYVFGKNAAITNAPVGTVVTTSDDAIGTRVNGKAFSEDATAAVKKETPSGGGDTPYTPPTPPAPTTYTVTFDVQGHGSAPASQTVAENGKVTEPTAPTADGWTFGGWYKDADCTDDWDFATDEVTANTTLYAKWKQMTIADVLATVAGGFPAAGSNDVPPSNAWVCGANYAYKYGSILFLKNVAEPETTWIPLNTTVEVDNEFYKASTDDYVMTFNMVEDKLISFVCEAKSESLIYAKYNGTYAPAVSVTSVSLNITELGLTAGDDQKLTATVAPDDATNKAVNWSSSDESVATVDNEGNVHAVSTGTATITVTTVDGNKTASCTVTVTAATVSVTGVSLDKTEVTIEVGDEDVKLTATVIPDNATDKAVNWSSSNNGVATVDNAGNVHAVAAGEATITVTTVDGHKTASCDVTAAPAEYSIIVEDDGNGTAKATVGGVDVTSAAPGTSVTLVATPNDRYQIKEWQVVSGGISVNKMKGTFTMPANEVKVKAVFQRVYTIEVVVQGHGTASASAEKSITNREITLTATPEDGYQLDHWEVESGGVIIGDNNKFFVGTEDVKIKAVFAEISADVKVTGISLDKTDVTIEVGDKVKLTATVIPDDATDKAVNWSSDTESVATVDNEGNVHAVAAGNATITVTTVDGGKTASCDVKVTESVATGNPNVFTYQADAALNFTAGTYGTNTIQSGNLIVINGITGNLSITGDTTGREIHAFVQSGGSVTSENSNGTIKAYIGGSENAQGTITAGTEAVTPATTGFTGVDTIFANTTGKITVGTVSLATIIDLNKVDADIAITTPIGPTIAQTQVLMLNNLFINADENDKISCVVDDNVKKVKGTNGSDTISMAGNNNSTNLTEIDISEGGGNDTVIVNTDLWKYDSNNMDKYTITLKANDRVYIDGATSETSSLKSGDPYKHLHYDKNNGGTIDDGDIVIQIIGANSITNVVSCYITFGES